MPRVSRCRHTLAATLALGLLAASPGARAQNGTDGAYPQGGVITVGGLLYGTTEEGGTANYGTVFSLTRGGAEKMTHSFEGNPNTTDGGYPQTGLIDVGGTLYGTTPVGGASGYGTVFSITTKGVEKVLYSFQGGSDGASPQGGLVNVGGTLYGTTESGGSNGYGTVFSITTAGGEKVLYSFKGGSDGEAPVGTLIDVGGFLYGTTYDGGGYGYTGYGTVFRVSTAGKEKVLYAFKGPYDNGDGEGPNGGLIDVGGTLYGTTYAGGAGGFGSVFSVTKAGAEKILYSFALDTDGANPSGSLLNVGGILFGTNRVGGAHNGGTVFSVSRAGAESVLYSFEGGVDGANPLGSLIDVGGIFYGTTGFGGASNDGTVFSVTKAGVEKVVYAFKGE
jgi:uncharacterized repeat protein (TIGR03803 family)